ncbi:DsbA family protein [Bifidobacterium psychraerophilum]|uniref:DsbA family protein n=1 Tax=Bifidobacterium psychraerophilum TaxID=218140 RepID=UPI00333FCC0A
MTRPMSGKDVKVEAKDVERKQQTLLGVVAFVVVMLLIMVVALLIHNSNKPTTSALDKSYASLQQVKAKPGDATKQGGVLISVDGAAKKRVPTIEMYLDPMCPACAQVDRALNTTLQKLFDAGQINVDIHAVTFLNRVSSDKYSTRAAAALAYVAEHDSRHAIDFIGELYAEDYLPSESNYTPTSDAQIAEQAVKAGVSDTVAQAAVTSDYGSWVDRATTYTIARKELVQQGSDGFTTPLFRINGHIWERQQIENADLPEAFATSLGLAWSDVGNPKVLPSIGAHGAVA